MKKTIALLLAIIVLALLCSCGSQDSEPANDPNAIKITAENFDKYFKTTQKSCSCDSFDADNAVNVSGVFGQYGFDLGTGSTTLYFYKKIDSISVIIEGASPNFNYNDIEVTFKCSGTYKEIVGITPNSKIGDAKDFSTELKVKCNIAGEGEAFTEYALPEGHYTCSELINAKWEIVSVSGTITPTK